MRPVTPSAAARSRFACLLFGLLGLLGCSGDGLTPASPITDPGAVRDVLWGLRLNHRAALLSTEAPYDTLTISATPVNIAGEPMTGLGAPIYTSSAPELLTIGSDGVIRARDVGSRVSVIASLSIGNITRKDTLFVDIVDLATPPVLTTFSAHPVPPDSAKVSLTPFFTNPLQGRATDENGNPMTVPVYYASSDPTTLSIDRSTGELGTDRKIGQVSLYASTIAFGVAKTDTVPFRVGLGVSASFSLITRDYLSGPTLLLEPTEVRVPVGGLLRFFNTAKIPGLDIIFTDPEKVLERSLSLPPNGCFFVPDCGRGNIIGLDTTSWFGIFPDAERAIYVPGVYGFTIPQVGLSGRIVVVDSD